MPRYKNINNTVSGSKISTKPLSETGLGDLSVQAVEDRRRQQERETSGIAELRKAIALFDEDYGKGAEKRALATASSQLISSGLGGTTRPGAVSAGLSAEFEDMRRGRLSTAMSNLANFFGTYRDPTMVTPGTVLQGVGQEQQYQLGRSRLGISMLGLDRPTGRNTRFTPGPASASTPTSTPAAPMSRSVWEPLAPFNKRTGGDGSGLEGFDPAAANVRLGNVLQTPPATKNNWFNWQDPLDFEGLNFGA